jgi:cellulose synthase/poly-beta-1,6-N-acetylglucosamine synthase-like glycosyltransferase
VIELQQVLYVMVLACFAYLSVIFLVDVVLLAVSAIENGRRIRQRRGESLNAVFSSEYVMPVSVVVPVHNEETVIVAVVRSLLRLEYPQHEVVVVNDGSSDGTLALLQREFALERRATFARQRYSRGTDPVTYRSRTDPRLVVVDGRVNRGSKALALNLGLDFCRYPYVCCVDGDTIYERSALVRAMTPVHRDPERVVGVTSRIGVSTQPELHVGDENGAGGVADMSFLGAFQHLEYLRSFLNDRLAWSRLGFMLCTSGAFMLYRRDLLDEVGGFSQEFSCEDIEITFRIHEHLLRAGREYRIVALPDKVATTEGPASPRALVIQRARWQRVTLETIWHYRRMIGNPRYKSVGLIGTPFFFLSEALAPVFEAVGALTVVLAAALGVFEWKECVIFIGVITFANALLATAGIWLEDASSRDYRVRDIVRLVALGPLELIAYRPILAWARVRGTIGFFRGERAWGKFDRNDRSTPGRVSPVAG